MTIRTVRLVRARSLGSDTQARNHSCESREPAFLSGRAHRCRPMRASTCAWHSKNHANNGIGEQSGYRQQDCDVASSATGDNAYTSTNEGPIR